MKLTPHKTKNGTDREMYKKEKVLAPFFRFSVFTHNSLKMVVSFSHKSRVC